MKNTGKSLFSLPLLCGYTRLFSPRRWIQRRMSHSAAYFETYLTKMVHTLKQKVIINIGEHLRKCTITWKSTFSEESLVKRFWDSTIYQKRDKGKHADHWDLIYMYKNSAHLHEPGIPRTWRALCYRQRVTRDSGNGWQT